MCLREDNRIGVDWMRKEGRSQGYFRIGIWQINTILMRFGYILVYFSLFLSKLLYSLAGRMDTRGSVNLSDC